MHIIQVNLADKKHVRDFLTLPFSVYKDIRQWVPPLQMDERFRLDPKRNPFYKHSQAAFFLAYKRSSPVDKRSSPVDKRSSPADKRSSPVDKRSSPVDKRSSPVDEETRPIGRLAVLDNRHYNDFNKEATAFFYLFECENNVDAAHALFNSAFDWARARGLTRIIGPKGFTPLDGFGLLVKGFEHRPAFGLPYNPVYYVDLIEAQGFQPNGEAVSGYLDPNIHFPERIHQLAERLVGRRGLRIARSNNRAELRALIPHIKELYNASLEGTTGNTPLTDEEIGALANQILWLADPRLIKLVMKIEDPLQGNDKAVGFMFAYPDVSAALQKTRGRLFPLGWLTLLRELKRTDWLNINGAGLLPEYRGSGGTAILYSEMFKSVLESGQFRHAEVVQIGVENEAMQREMENFGIDFHKTHRVYQREIA